MTSYTAPGTGPAKKCTSSITTWDSLFNVGDCA